jgi:tetratricopeptide (TPR) repeat protein
MKQLMVIFFVLIASIGAFAQDTDEQLANYYYSAGDCDKAIIYLEKVYQRNPTKFTFTRLLECTKQVKGDKEVINLLRKQIKTYPEEYEYQVTLGKELESQGDTKAAEKAYQELMVHLALT